MNSHLKMARDGSLPKKEDKVWGRREEQTWP